MVKELLEKYNITQQELADFTGIQRATLGKWVSENKIPPKANDLKKIQIAETFFASMSKEDAKKAVSIYHIVANNVELKANASNLIKEKQEKQCETLGTSFASDNIPDKTGKSQIMMYSLIESQRDYAIAAKDAARANLILAELLKESMETQRERMSPNKKAS